MSIAKETLFRAVGRGEVLLWVGSGFSLYAGYPSGWGLVQILHEGLTPSQQKQLNPNDPLPRYAEQYINLHDGRRNELTRELMRVFNASPKSLATHELLTTVSFIDQIVTTNYDSLFELAYGHRLHKVTQGKNIPFGELNQVTLYKVHGDLQNPDSLVVSDKDFRGFFKKQDELLWTSLKALMAKRHLVFVGYSLEDPNVKELFEWLLETLGTQMREAYFIAPNQSELTQKWLTHNKLTYINSTGELLVEELVSELKESVLPDLKKGLVSQDKASQFLDRLGMNFGYSNNSQGLDITYLGKKDGETKQVFSFKVKDSTPSSDGLKKVIAGKTLDPVRLSAADDFQGIIRVEGLRMPDEIVEAIILPRAAWSKTADIYFADGTCFPGVNVKAYGNKSEIRIVVSSRLNKAKITVKRSALRKAANGFKVNVIVGANGEHYASTEALLENSEILRCLGQGMSFRCMQDGQLIYEGLERKIMARTIADGEALRTRVEDIKQIEKAFSIVFRDFALTKEEWDNIISLAKLLRQEGRVLNLNAPMTFNLDDSEEANEWRKTFASTKDIGAVAAERTDTWTYQFFGWKLELQVVVLHVINNAIVKFNKKNNDYSVVNKKKEINYVVKEIVSKRIISPPTPVVKSLKPSIDDFIKELD